MNMRMMHKTGLSFRQVQGGLEPAKEQLNVRRRMVLPVNKQTELLLNGSSIHGFFSISHFLDAGGMADEY
ncbi:MAG: hypothetical protein HGB29_02550 [Chlorobiaceae bacterium]|nr:hypothetical protein [Chlorobiaceae bacterium]